MLVGFQFKQLIHVYVISEINANLFIAKIVSIKTQLNYQSKHNNWMTVIMSLICKLAHLSLQNLNNCTQPNKRARMQIFPHYHIWFQRPMQRYPHISINAEKEPRLLPLI